MADGSDAIADWPLLNALVNTASGASWVSIHHGGGVGIGRSIHAGQVSVADGTALAAQKLERVLTNDPGMGVIRHVDAGYELADTVAPSRRACGSRCGRAREPGPSVSPRCGRSLAPARTRRADRRLPALLLVAGGSGLPRLVRRGGGRPADCRWRPTATATCGPGSATRQSGDAVVTGSHLDSVPHGGGYDGPLGVVVGLPGPGSAAPSGVSSPGRPVGVVAFTEEEGSRFGVACLGSRLLTGAIDAGPARRRCATGTASLAGRAMRAAGRTRRRPGRRPGAAGPDRHLRRAAHRAGPGAGRAGRGGQRRSGHTAGGGWTSPARATTRAPPGWRDRHDPMLTFAFTVLAASKAARLSGSARHDRPGRRVEPNATNAIAARSRAWLDARRRGQADAGRAGRRDHRRRPASGPSATVRRLSVTRGVGLRGDRRSTPALRDRLAALLGGAPILPTGAGHDAGVLAAARTHRDAVRPQPDRRLARAGRVRHRRRLRGGRRGTGRRAGGAGVPGVTVPRRVRLAGRRRRAGRRPGWPGTC